MATEPNLPIGLNDPQFSLEKHESYGQDALKRFNIRRKAEKGMIDLILEKETQFQGDELIKYIDEYVVPIAITNYLKSKKDGDNSTFSWKVDAVKNEFHIILCMDRDKYIVKTDCSIHNIYIRVCGYIIARFKTVLNIKTYASYNTTFPQMCYFNIVLPLDSL